MRAFSRHDGNGEIVGIACAVCFAVTLGLALMNSADDVAKVATGVMSGLIDQLEPGDAGKDAGAGAGAPPAPVATEPPVVFTQTGI